MPSNSLHIPHQPQPHQYHTCAHTCSFFFFFCRWSHNAQSAKQNDWFWAASWTPSPLEGILSGSKQLGVSRRLWANSNNNQAWNFPEVDWAGVQKSHTVGKSFSCLEQCRKTVLQSIFQAFIKRAFYFSDWTSFFCQQKHLFSLQYSPHGALGTCTKTWSFIIIRRWMTHLLLNMEIYAHSCLFYQILQLSGFFFFLVVSLLELLLAYPCKMSAPGHWHHWGAGQERKSPI